MVAGEFVSVDIVEKMEFSGGGLVTRHRCGVIGYGDAVEDADDVLARVALRVAAHCHQARVVTDDSGFFGEFAQNRHHGVLTLVDEPAWECQAALPRLPSPPYEQQFQPGISHSECRRIDRQGRVVICEQVARRVVRYEADGSITVLADRFEGKRLNRSNDVVLHPDGSVYFTDPDKKGLPGEEKELGYAAIFRLGANRELTLLASDMNHPNGLAFSRDHTTLYVSNRRPDPHLHAYDVSPGGELTRSRVVCEMPYGPAGEVDGVPDGLKLDGDGNIYSTGPGGIWVWD